MASALVARTNRAKVVLLILLLLSSGLSAPAASALQGYQNARDFYQLNVPVMQASAPSGSGVFFSQVVGSPSSGSYSPGSAELGTPSSLPQIPVTGSGADYLYFRQGDVYKVSPENIIENGGSSYTLVVLGPLLSVWLDSERRRSRFRIYVEILDLLRRGPMTPYEVSFHLRLNSKRTREYIDFLSDKKFLDFSDQDGRILCTVTPPGLTFVENLRMILGENQ